MILTNTGAVLVLAAITLAVAGQFVALVVGGFRVVRASRKG